MIMTRTNKTQMILKLSKRFWFICLAASQLVFVTYLALGYGFSALNADPAKWNNFNATAYVAEDTLGNTIYGIHVLFAIVMIVGGSLQLIPTIRNKLPRFHRINGRLFVVLACTIALAGMYLIIVRGTVGNTLMHSMTFFAGTVVLVSSYFAVLTARKKQFNHHQIWAIRLYLAANGVLFFRLTLFAWFIVFGSIGINTKDFTGPTLVMISVSSYILPLFLFELLRYAEKTRNTVIKGLMITILLVISLVFLVGLFGISAGSWFPALIKG